MVLVQVARLLVDVRLVARLGRRLGVGRVVARVAMRGVDRMAGVETE